MDAINEVILSDNGRAGSAADPFAGIPGFESRFPPFSDQDSYLESWRRLVLSLLVGENENPSGTPLQGMTSELEVLAGRADQALKLGISIPVEVFLRKHGFDMVDRICFFALLCRSLDSGYRRGTSIADLKQILGANVVRREVDLRRRLDEYGKLPVLALLQHDGDENWEQRVYRLAPRQVPVILGLKTRPSDGIEIPSDPHDAYDALVGEIEPLYRLIAKRDSGRGLIWLSRVPSTSEWLSDESIRVEVLCWIAAFRRQATAPFGTLVRDTDLDPISSLVLASLTYLHGIGMTSAPVQLVREMAGLFSKRSTPVEKFVGPDSALMKAGLISLEGPGPLRARRVRISQAWLSVLVPYVITSFEKGEEERVPGVEDPLELVESDGRTLADVVLPAKLRERIEFHTSRLANARTTLRSWGFKNASQMRPALLFHGPSGTGKTVTARAIANELGVTLLKLRLDQVRSRWSGEAEKQITRAFRRAQDEKALLLLDEADAVVGDRDELPALDVPVTNLLLQAIENFTGPLILTTNRIGTLDPALERRLSARLEFQVPDLSERMALWRFYLPSEAPLAADVDFEVLARLFELTGAGIERACLEAAMAASVRSEPDRRIQMADLVTAAGHGAEKWSRSRPVGFRQPGSKAAGSRVTQTVEYVQGTKNSEPESAVGERTSR